VLAGRLEIYILSKPERRKMDRGMAQLGLEAAFVDVIGRKKS
jgi:hypothetical protein